MTNFVEHVARKHHYKLQVQSSPHTHTTEQPYPLLSRLVPQSILPSHAVKSHEPQSHVAKRLRYGRRNGLWEETQDAETDAGRFGSGWVAESSKGAQTQHSRTHRGYSPGTGARGMRSMSGLMLMHSRRILERLASEGALSPLLFFVSCAVRRSTTSLRSRTTCSVLLSFPRTSTPLSSLPSSTSLVSTSPSPSTCRETQEGKSTFKMKRPLSIPAVPAPASSSLPGMLVTRPQISRSKAIF